MKSFRDILNEKEGDASSKDIKAWFKSRGVAVKASKMGSKFLQASVTDRDNVIPNEVRKEIMKKVMPEQKPKNMDDIDYGNITKHSIALQHADWNKLLGL